MTKNRNPYLAALLSLVPGLGQIYNGQPVKGLIFWVINLLIPFVFGILELTGSFGGLMAFAAFIFLFLIYRIIDGFVVARRRPNYELRPYNKWYVYAGYVVLIGVVGMFLNHEMLTGIQSFHVVSPSMYPTLREGDKVVANVRYYDGDRNIERGDIVVFNSPPSDMFPQGIWIFRVIGLPGDSVSVEDGTVFINGKQMNTRPTGELILDGIEVVQYSEELPSGRMINTVGFKEITRRDAPFLKVKVPGNEYFLMGDNRDNALDSRYIGTIKRDDILGRAIYSYWGKTNDRINIDFTTR